MAPFLKIAPTPKYFIRIIVSCFLLLQKITSHPAFLKEVDFSRPLHPATEALMVMKYEEEDPRGMLPVY